MLQQADAGYQAQAPENNLVCGRCRWWNGEGEMPCRLVVNEPLTIEAGGFCQRWDANPEAPPLPDENSPDEGEQAGEYGESAPPALPPQTTMLVEGVELLENTLDVDARKVDVVIIRPGWSKNGRYYSPEVLQKAAGLFEGVKAYANHPTMEQLKSGDGRDVRDITGDYTGVRVGSGGEILATRHVYGVAGDAVWPLITRALETKRPVVGISINAVGKASKGKAAGREGLIIEDITHANSADDVDMPAAGGGFQALVAGTAHTLVGDILEALTLDEITNARQDLLDEYRGTLDVSPDDLQEARTDRDKAMQGWRKSQTDNETLQGKVDATESRNVELAEEVTALQESLQRTALEVELERVLAEARLPADWASDIREQCKQLPPEQWLKVVQRDQRKAKAVKAAPRVHVEGAPLREQEIRPPQPQPRDMIPRPDEDYADWNRRMERLAAQGK